MKYAISFAMAWCSIVACVARAGALPVPDSKAQTAAEAAVRDIFKTDFAKRQPDARRALAQKLLEEGEKSDEPAAKYALLRQSAEVSAGIGDYDAMESAVASIGQAFTLDAALFRADLLLKSVPPQTGAAANQKLAEVCLSAAAALLDEGNFDLASRTAGSGATAGRKAKDSALTIKLETLERSARESSIEETKFKAAQTKLATNNSDLDANLVVGRHLCLSQGKWEAGLPFLAKGSDAPLKALAEADMANPADPKAQIKVGDGWYELAAKDRSQTTQHNAKARAAHWYWAADAQLTGLERVRVEKRIAEAGETASSRPSEAPSGLDSKSPVAATRPAAISGAERRRLIDQQAVLGKAAESETNPQKQLDTLLERAKITLQLDPATGVDDLESMASRAGANNDADHAGDALILEGKYLGSLGKWQAADACLSRVWKQYRGSYGDRGAAAAGVMAKHFIDARQPAAAVPYQEIVMDCGGSYGAAGGDAGLWLADYCLSKGDKAKATILLKRVVEKYAGWYGACKDKAQKKLNELGAS